MPKINVPTDAAGLQEFMNDPAKVKAVFSAESVADGTNRQFVDAYSKLTAKKDSDLEDQVRTQTQSALFDLLRENGVGDTPGKLNLGNMSGLSNGRTDLLAGAGLMSARHRGAAYNKDSLGAKMEAQISAEDQFHSVGELCQAIRYSTSKLTGPTRNELIRKLGAAESFRNAFSSEDPGAGGYLIPETMRSEIFQLALEESVVRSRATVIPMSTLSVRIPTVDDTSHVSSVFGGVTFAWTEESASIPSSQATFDSVQLTAKKLAGTFAVPNELLSDAPAFSGYFDTQIPKGLAFKEDLSFFSESGVGAPLGFINCEASVSVAAQSGQPTKTITWENVLQMYSQMYPASVGNAVWIVSPDAFPQLGTMSLSVGTGGGPVWIGGYGNSGGAGSPPATILGRPVIVSEKASALGTSGDISFVDLSYYLIGDRQSVEVAASDQILFQQNQTMFRLIERVDGRPWLQSPLTPANGSSNLLSTFVQLASR